MLRTINTPKTTSLYVGQSGEVTLQRFEDKIVDRSSRVKSLVEGYKLRPDSYKVLKKD